MIKRLLLIILITSLFVACSTLGKLQMVELGMTKAEVVKVLGKGYTPITLDRNEHDTFETIRYSLSRFSEREEFYYFDFKNNILLRWYKESDQPYAYPVPVPVSPNGNIQN